jgi:aconitate hydratase 2/2-methylisocitrate dehydratase
LTDENAAMLQAYREHTEERAREGIPPKPLDARQTADLVELIKNPPAGEADYLLELLTQHVPAGVDEAAYVKAGFLAAITRGEASTPLIDKVRAVEILGTMLGGYNIEPLIACLDDDETAPAAVAALSHTLLVFDAFHDVVAKSEAGNAHARQVLESWANADWFTSKPPLADKITVTVFKVPGETNTDDLSPAQDAWSRPDIPLHANAMLKNPRDGLTDKPLEKIAELKQLGHPLAYVGDVVASATWWAPARRVNRLPTRCCGIWARIFPTSRTSATAATASAARSRRFSSTPWKTRVRCRSRWTFRK